MNVENCQSILYWNCASGFFNKLDIMKTKILEHSPEMLFVAESNINLEMCSDILQIDDNNFLNSRTISENRKSIEFVAITKILGNQILMK